MYDVIAFDADDTLWHNMPLYEKAQHNLSLLLADYVDADTLDKKLFAVETRNIQYFGYGIKSFTLSMMQTAVEIIGGAVPGDIILKILDIAKDMLTAPIQLIESVPDVLDQVSATHDLMIITKGDLLDQQAKVERSGIAGYFSKIEVVNEKNPETYARILTTHHIDPRGFLMVGNSLKSDVLPVLAVGGSAVHIPHDITWAYEDVTITAEDSAKHVELKHIGLLPGWLKNSVHAEDKDWA